MSFVGVGPLELIVILVVALLVVGPERLPRLAADIARTIREVRQYTGRLAAEFTDVVQEFEREAENEKATWKDVGEGLSGASQSVTKAVDEVRAEAASLPATVAGTPPKPAVTNGTREAANGNGAWVDVPEPDVQTGPPDEAPAAQGKSA